MTTIVIEILRPGQATTQLLEVTAKYISLCGPGPAKDLLINCDQKNFDDNVKLLRYNTPASSRQAGIDFFQNLISSIVDQIYPDDFAEDAQPGMLHLRLVTTPSEIAQLPFEMALTPAKLQTGDNVQPFFINPVRKTTFTREVRHVAFKNYKWPLKPRILFAWAGPGNNTVPHEDHNSALKQVLAPWALPRKDLVDPTPCLKPLLTELGNATLQSLRAAITEAYNKNAPYTHIHLLAHGTGAGEKGDQFLLVLNSDDAAQQYHFATGDELAQALIIQQDGKYLTPQVVSLIACDSGNVGSPVHPVGSLAHWLHLSGIPSVFASQFPLTQDGSVQLVDTLYARLLQSSDPRVALYNTRCQLYQPNTHDWASLVAYARFPEDIDSQVKNVTLSRTLEFMKTANAYSDHVLNNITQINKANVASYFTEVSKRLDKCLANLTDLVQSNTANDTNKARYAEHYGLIASAYKRKAELLFRKAVFDNIGSVIGLQGSLDALTNAMDWYYKGYTEYMYSHWVGTQFLSLALILKGSIASGENRDMWTLCRIMAENDEKKADNDDNKAWAYGTLAELYLLKPFAFNANPASIELQTDLLTAKAYMQKLSALNGVQFPQESTARQFERYINWWPVMIESKTTAILKDLALQLRQLLPELSAITYANSQDTGCI